MAHFAELDSNNIVLRVLVVDNEVTENESGIDVEVKGIDFLEGLYGHRNWAQTSYNTRYGVHLTGKPQRRKNFASPGYKFDPTEQAFISPKPFPSWILDNQTALWNPPTAKPNDGSYYSWNEENQSWDLEDGV
jgi:hypothetical protein|tara:strand:- start:52 stop:450 length:399 start_codon:yes stop_codon:yes gene_type:complete